MPCAVGLWAPLSCWEDWKAVTCTCCVHSTASYTQAALSADVQRHHTEPLVKAQEKFS